MKVLVTGGTGGLGLAMASALATAGATVALTGRSGERASSVAAHHPTLYIESSMGTGLVGKVYGGVIRRYEGKGPLNIDAEIEAARKAALTKHRRLRSG